MIGFLKKLDKTVQFVLRCICIVLFAALMLLLLGNVFLRLSGDLTRQLRDWGLEGAANAIRAILPITSFHWMDEIVEFCFSSLTFYGAAAIWAIKGHFSVGDWISKRLPGPVSRNVYKLIINGICIAFLAIFFRYSLVLVANATELSTVFQIPKKINYSSLAISSGIMLIYALVELVQNLIHFKVGETT